MKSLFRVLVTFVSGLAAFYFVFWVGGALLFGAGTHSAPWVPLAATGAAVVAAVLVAGSVWAGTASAGKGLIGSVALGAVVVGGIGFVAGFFGPIVFTPGANQGPLLGIFITGPLGFLLGAVGGAVYWRRWGRGRVAS